MTRLFALLSVLVLAALAVPATAVATAFAACPDRSSWLAGSVDLCAGSLIYRDYVYDDYGKDDPLVPAQMRSTTGSLARPAGDERYPAGQESTADIVDVTVRIVGDRLEAVFEMNALYDSDSTIVALAIDSDNDRTTGGGQWEDLKVASKGWDVLATFRVGDPRTNVIEGSIPVPAGDVWRVQAVAAQASGTVMNVAFRGTDERTTVGAWWEDKQAAALADGDITEFAQEVRVSDLRSGVTRPAAEEKGFHQRVYTSRYTLAPGEGMSYQPKYGRHGHTNSVCEQMFHFFGPYQPYGVYVPDSDAGAALGMQLALHGCNANHSSLVDQPGMQRNLGDATNRVVVVPLGRGPIGYYSDISERDVLDVMDDVLATYEIDRRRVFSGGYSMGGYGAYRFAMLYPDRFAGFISWVGFTGDCTNAPAIGTAGDCASGAIGNVYDFVRNLRHVPGAMLYGGADELVHASSAVAMDEQFRQHEVPYVWYMHPAAEHFTFALADDWRKEAAWTHELLLVERPARVTYRTDPSLAFPEWDISHDQAYWVSDITARDSGYVDIDVLSTGCGGAVAEYEMRNAAGPDPVPWVADSRAITGREALEQGNRLEATVANLAAAVLDAEEACLAMAPLEYKITTDGPVTLQLSDGRALHLAGEGTFEGVLAERAATSFEGATPGANEERPVRPARNLPATGTRGVISVAGLVFLGAALVLRRRTSCTPP